MKQIPRGCMVVLLALVAACGSESPTRPSAPVTPPAPASFTGQAIDTISGAPVEGLTTTVVWPRVTLSAPGYITRETRNAPSIDLIPNSAPFDLEFYRRFARNTFENPTGMEPLRRQRQLPSFYIRTVDEKGEVLNGRTVDVVAARLDVAAFTGGLFRDPVIERGTGTREGQAGWVTIKFLNPAQPDFCGRAAVGGTWIEFNYLRPTCSCGGAAVFSGAIRHELGHVMGFWHTGSADDVMHSVATSCEKDLSPRERLHASIVYRRPVGNLDMDVDPINVSLVSRVVVD